MAEENIKILVTERPEGPEDKSVVKTPSGEANITIVTMNAWRQAFIRALRTYLQVVVAGLGAAGFAIGTAVAYAALAGAPVQVPAQAFLWTFVGILGGSLWSFAVSFIWNALEIINKLDVTNPGIRA